MFTSPSNNRNSSLSDGNVQQEKAVLRVELGGYRFPLLDGQETLLLEQEQCTINTPLEVDIRDRYDDFGLDAFDVCPWA